MLKKIQKFYSLTVQFTELNRFTDILPINPSLKNIIAKSIYLKKSLKYFSSVSIWIVHGYFSGQLLDVSTKVVIDMILVATETPRGSA